MKREIECKQETLRCSALSLATPFNKLLKQIALGRFNVKAENFIALTHFVQCSKSAQLIKATQLLGGVA